MIVNRWGEVDWWWSGEKGKATVCITRPRGDDLKRQRWHTVRGKNFRRYMELFRTTCRIRTPYFWGISHTFYPKPQPIEWEVESC